MLVSDLVTGRELAVIMETSYWAIWRMTKHDVRMEACSVRLGKKKRKYSLKQLQAHGFIRQEETK